MEIQYKIAESDYVNSIKLAARSSKKQLISLGVGGAALLSLGVFGPKDIKFIGYFAFVCGVLGYVISLHIISPWYAKRHYRNYKAIQAPIYISLQDDGLTIKTENGQNKVKWDNLLKWRENSNYVLVYFAPKLFYMVPKNISDLGFDLERLRKILQEKVGPPI